MIEDRYQYNSVDVATYVVAYANENRFGINMTKLQKLLYIMYGTFLSVRSFRFVDEHPQAWPNGPVFARVRKKMLKREFPEITMADVDESLKGDAELEALTNLVFKHFGTWNGDSLAEWSFKPGTAWERTVNMPGFDWGRLMPDYYIKEYFDSIITHHG